VSGGGRVALHCQYAPVFALSVQEGPLRLSQILKIATEVSRGMDYLHQRKIIHRDLKAANLLMDDHAIVKVRGTNQEAGDRCSDSHSVHHSRGSARRCRHMGANRGLHITDTCSYSQVAPARSGLPMQ
jgi:serine/threonine protein kinase